MYGYAVGWDSGIFFGMAVLYGVTLVALGTAQMGDERPYLLVGSASAFYGLYLLTLGTYVSADAPLLGLHNGRSLLVTFVMMLCAAVAAVLLSLKRSQGKSAPVVGVLVLVGLAGLVANALEGIPAMFTASIALFAGSVCLVVLGIDRRSEMVVNLGLGFIAIQLITRYFDIFFSAMDRSLFFVIGGILLMGGGLAMERNRRHLIKRLGGGSHAA